MSKKRKTKKEKIEALERHDFSQVFSFSQVPQITLPQKEQIRTPAQTSAITHSYVYVAKDVKSTLTITLALIAIEVILFFLLKENFINFAGIVF